METNKTVPTQYRPRPTDLLDSHPMESITLLRTDTFNLRELIVVKGKVGQCFIRLGPQQDGRDVARPQVQWYVWPAQR